MRDKYIEERFPRYFIFGEDDCDISDGQGSTIALLSKEDADIVIRDRNEVIDILIALAQKLDDIDPYTFREVWYGQKVVR